jgi:MarR family 2-MHQ and catechol resistance regulon transcriptional repressor
MTFEITNKQKSSLGALIKLMRATNSVSQNVHGHLAEFGLTHSQFAVLEALYHLGSLCQGELSSKILKSNANITSVVDALEKKNLAVRDRAEDDRRKVLVQLTDEGKGLVSKIFPKHAELVEQEFSVLTEKEKKELSSLLKKLGVK